MCKSADDPNGPYRCPGDAQRGLDRAHARLQDATVEVENSKLSVDLATFEIDQTAGHISRIINQPEALWTRDGHTAPAQEHIRTLVETGDLSPSASNLPPTEAFERYRATHNLAADDPATPRFAGDENPAYQAQEARWGSLARTREHWRGEKEKAERRVQKARSAVQDARANFDSTTRGLGMLQADYDETVRVTNPDAAAPSRMQARLDAAVQRINADAAIRLQKNGREPDDFQYMPLHTGETTQPRGGDIETTSRSRNAAQLAQRDHITGASKAYKAGTPEAGDGHTLHVVTLTRQDDEGIHEAKFRVRTPAGAPAPTCADVLQEVNSRARNYDTAAGEFERWRSHHGFPEKSADPAAYASAKKTYSAHAADAARLADFLGASRYSEYVQRA